MSSSLPSARGSPRSRPTALARRTTNGSSVARRIGQPTESKPRRIWGLEKHVYPLIGEKAITAITRSDIEGVVEALDAKVQTGLLRWKTAHNTWGVLSKSFDDATNAKSRVLRVLATNPALGVREAENLRETFGTVFPPLPSRLFTKALEVSLDLSQLRETIASPAGHPSYCTRFAGISSRRGNYR